MDFPTEATRRLSDEELEGALAQINRTIQGLEEQARGRDDPAQWGEPRVGEAILQGLYRRRCRREEMKLELLHRGIARNSPATPVVTGVPAIAAVEFIPPVPADAMNVVGILMELRETLDHGIGVLEERFRNAVEAGSDADVGAEVTSAVRRVVLERIDTYAAQYEAEA